MYFSTPITTANDIFAVEIMKLSVLMGQNPHLFHTSVIVSVEVSVNRVGRDEF
jgi:hypothetical protein